MDRKKAAACLVEMACLLRKEGYVRSEYSEAVALACGVLLVDDVLSREENSQ